MVCTDDGHVSTEKPIQLQLLGRWSLTVGSETVAVSTGGQRLLAVLALRGVSRRRRLSGIVWPDTTQQFASGRLRTALWRLGEYRALLLHELADTLELCPRVDIDVHRLDIDAIAHSSHSDGICARKFLDRDLLVDWDDEWLDVDREQVRQTRLHALEKLADRMTAQGRYLDAVLAGLTALNEAPLRESAHRAVIAAHLAEGNFDEARTQYNRCRQVFRVELDIEPSRQLRSMLSIPSPVRSMTA